MNKIIIYDNKKCQFFTPDKTLFNKLRKHLSFRMAGVEYTQAYKNGWNGITYVIDEKGRFSIGLINIVKTFLTESNNEFIIEDTRKAIPSNPELDISKALLQHNLNPRDYQSQIVDATLQNQRGIVRACTGSGKTLCTALITAKLNKPTIIYVIGLDLLKQFHDLFSKLFDEKIGFIGNGVCDIQRINIASIWTIGKSLNVDDIISDDEIEGEEKYSENNKSKILKMLNETKVHILDECHLCTTNTIKSIYKNIDPEHLYGFSGTPFRDDNSDLLANSILGEQIINISASELIAKNVLAQPIIKFVPIPAIGMTTSTYPHVYKNYVVENVVRNSIIVQETKNLLDKGYSPLVLFKQIKHGETLKELFEEAGFEFGYLSGKDSLDDRTQVKSDFEKGKIRVILASTIYDIGVDLPKLNGLVLCGSGRSSVKTLQRIGRCIRAFPGKKFAAVVDFFDQTKFLKKHSLIRYNTYLLEAGFKVIKCKNMK